MIAAAVTALLAAVTPPPLGPQPTHDQAISLFASTMAIARTARESCPGTTINEDYLEDLRQRLGVVEADHPVFAGRAHEIAEAMKKALAEAPSREAWCANLYVLYGPTGTMIPMLLQRP